MQSIILFVLLGRLKNEKMCSEMVKNRPKKCKMCSIYGSSEHCHDNSCRINDVLVLVFSSTAQSA